MSSERISKHTLKNMEMAGINKRFKAHSIRHAMASALADLNVDKERIRSAGQWKSNVCMDKHYFRSNRTIDALQEIGSLL
ncbi:hypothetical protein CYY_004527 [Polysphondylium violaceum]|uniref:Tyr recombinase domain-containing protein n=1 Tax=Polysphondylium violaceum TaxID=133409 RepID=A0A8J4Q566_9MYCE|nr:hypothetical protein CYY_004527 [Polysphondylium violaceum]